MKIFWIVFLCLNQILAQNWEKPQVVMTSEKRYGFINMYMDPSTNIAHFIYSHQTVGMIYNLFYAKLMPDHTVSSPIPILSGLQAYLNSEITGADDGKRIFIAACVKRNEDVDNKEIYFIESSNNGESFSNPVAVPREDMKDKRDRFSPGIRFNVVNQRLWIGYFSLKPGEDYLICTVTRPKDSSILGNEVIVYHSGQTHYPLKTYVGNDNNGNQVVILAFHDSYNGNINFLISRDNGINWRGEAIWTGRYRMADNTIYDVAYSDVTMDELIGIVTVKFDYNIAAVKWPETDPIFQPLDTVFLFNRGVLCKAVTDYTLLAYSTLDYNDMTKTNHGIFNIAHYSSFKKFVPGVLPFISADVVHVTSPSMECTYTSKEKGKVHVLATGVMKDGDYAILYNKGQVPQLSPE